MVQKRSYNTRQRQIIHEFLVANQSHYLSVDEIYAHLAEHKPSPGRTTVYRTLEAMVSQGSVSKVVAPGGGESRYRLANEGQENYGQLVCMCCGRVIPFDCDTLVQFSDHVHTEHQFSVDLMRSVMYGHCFDCATHTSPDVHEEK